MSKELEGPQKGLELTVGAVRRKEGQRQGPLWLSWGLLGPRTQLKNRSWTLSARLVSGIHDQAGDHKLSSEFLVFNFS